MQLRPVSNYYEYETVQSVLNSRSGIRPTLPSRSVQHPSTTYTHNSQPSNVYVDGNSNSLPRNQPIQGRGQISRASNQPHRGPFVTQVMIGEQQQNGTKV